MALAFKSIKLYSPEEVHFAGAMYFMDSEGRDWYGTSWELPANTMVVMVDPDTDYVRCWTDDVVSRPLSLVEGCSIYQVDHLPESLKNWTMHYSPERGFYELKETTSD